MSGVERLSEVECVSEDVARLPDSVAGPGSVHVNEVLLFIQLNSSQIDFKNRRPSISADRPFPHRSAPRAMSSTREPPSFAEFIGADLIVGDRERQEDDFLVLSFDAEQTDGCALLLIVADGMGGHAGGAEASQRAIKGYANAFANEEGGVATRLLDALDGASGEVLDYRMRHSELAGMGCTLVACAVTERGEAHWVSVGDSLLLHLRGGPDGEIKRMNEDHSARPEFEEMLRDGRLTEEEFKTAPVHQLYSAIMGGHIEMIDSGAPPVQLQPGDRLVVATDGLETLSNDEIQSICGEDRAMNAVVSELLAAVKDRAKPHQDNTTVLTYRHPDGPLPGDIGRESHSLLGPRPD